MILMIEDSFEDYNLFKELLAELGFDTDLIRYEDGVSAVADLKANNISPKVILLDINLPKKSGFQILSELKQDVELKDVPVIIFSTSDSIKDIKNAYRLGSNSYIVKPDNLENLIKTITDFGNFWLITAKT